MHSLKHNQVWLVSILLLSLILALVLSGNSALSQSSKVEFSDGDIAVEKPTYSTSLTTADNFAIAPDRIVLEIPVPYYVLPIPEEKLNLVGYWSFEMPITNNTDAPIFIGDGVLTPELISPDGEQIKLHRSRDRRFDQKNYCHLLASGESGELSSVGGLFWQNNSLQLRGRLGGEKFWYFNDLSSGTYQMRLVYDTPGGELSCYEIGSGNQVKIEGVGKATGITNFIPIRIVPVKYINNNTIEIDGIEFEIVMPKRVLTIAKKQKGVVTDIEVGLRITNKTNNPVRFSPYETLYLEVIGEDGQPLKLSYGRWSILRATEEDCPLLQPTESTIFWKENKIFWRNNQLVWKSSDKFGAQWFFQDEIAAGKYQIQLLYSPRLVANSGLNSYLCDVKKNTLGLSKDWWTGVAATPFMDFKIVRP